VAWEARTGPRQTQTCIDTPATARLRRGRPLTTLQPTKRQPATVGAVERGGRVTVTQSRRQGKRRRGQSKVAAPRPHTHAVAALSQLTMHISTNDLHCAPAATGPVQRTPTPPATAPPRIAPPHQQQRTSLEGEYPKDRYIAEGSFYHHRPFIVLAETKPSVSVRTIKRHHHHR
jgi:hypothetical protein